MTNPLIALVLYAAWALILVLGVFSWRGLAVLRGEKKVNEFPGGTQHGSPAYWRLNRAHLNTVENLPIFGAVVVAGVLLHVAWPAFQTLPLVVVGLRVVQSVAHVSAGSPAAATVRATAFALQIICLSWMIVVILRATGG